MEIEDIRFILDTIQSFYPPFEVPSVSMQHLWLEELARFDRPLVLRAIRQWARQHTERPPTIEQLTEQVEWVEEDDRKVMRREARKSLADTFTDAGNAQAANPERTPEEASYGQLMAMLAIRHLETWRDHHGVQHPKLTRAQMAEQCYTWASRARDVERWHLAEDLAHAGGMWRTWAEESGQRVQTVLGSVMFDDEDPALAFLT